MRMVTVLLATLAFLLAAVPASADERYDNTFMKDFIMDAPWRVTDATTAIPLTIIFKDCDADDIRDPDDLTVGDDTTGASAASLPPARRS